MLERKFKFDNTTKIGNIIYVDTTQVNVEIRNENIIPEIVVGHMVSIDTSKKHIKIIGLIEKVIRKHNEESEDDFECISKDMIKINLIGTFKSTYKSQRNIFKRGIENFPQIESFCHIVNRENLEFFMNILSENKKDSLHIGTYSIDKTGKAMLDGDKFFQRHAAILGSTGSGKSWCVAKILEKVSQLKYPNIIILDIHGEYKSLCKNPDAIGKYYKIAGPGDIDEKNEETLFLPYWLLNKEEILAMCLDTTDQHAINQSARFIHHTKELKKEKLETEKKEEILKSFTVDSPIPFDFNKLIEALKEDNERKGAGKNGNPIKGEFEDKLTRFIFRLETKYNDKRYGFMFQSPEECQNYDWFHKLIYKLIGSTKKGEGIKIIDFSEVPSDILPIITGIIARILFDIQIWMKDEDRTPFTLVCDEAHLYLPKKDSANAIEKKSLYNFERIAKEGRKYGISIVVVSQRPSEVSSTILSQCSNFIVLRLTNDMDKNTIKQLLPDSLKIILEQLSLLEIGEAIVVGDSILLPSRICLEEPRKKPNSDTKKFWKEWNEKESSEEKLKKAVEYLRGQNKNN
ncbi:ATP-binding protein [uncultured Cetobacterium sp.]|uniref:ATP-binding protein n=1 Tax=uncultured Cetobacterium sp. TaxID=527638 RepID=UPI00262EA1A9|nr:ATP-binding protein [uncultured Cetobacterium sp.]